MQYVVYILLVAVALTNVSSSSAATNTSATLTFSLNNIGCNVSASMNVYYQECADQVDCECPQDTSISTNERSISVTLSSITIVYSNLRAGVIYCYRSEVLNNGSIVGFENGQMFNTSRPVPPVMKGNAILVMSNPPTYRCVNSAEGFNGGSPQMVVAFNTMTLEYPVPTCSCE